MRQTCSWVAETYIIEVQFIEVLDFWLVESKLSWFLIRLGKSGAIPSLRLSFLGSSPSWRMLMIISQPLSASGGHPTWKADNLVASCSGDISSWEQVALSLRFQGSISTWRSTAIKQHTIPKRSSSLVRYCPKKKAVMTRAWKSVEAFRRKKNNVSYIIHSPWWVLLESTRWCFGSNGRPLELMCGRICVSTQMDS